MHMGMRHRSSSLAVVALSLTGVMHGCLLMVVHASGINPLAQNLQNLRRKWDCYVLWYMTAIK